MKTIYTLLDGSKIDVNEIVSITEIGKQFIPHIFLSKSRFHFSIVFKNRKEIHLNSDWWPSKYWYNISKDPVKTGTIHKEFTKEYNKLIKVWESL